MINKNNKPIKHKLTLGQKLSDKLTFVAGSWSFIIGLLLVIVIWMGINIYLITIKRWDPYPFILLNLVLSCLAAIQAPIILMSLYFFQNTRMILKRIVTIGLDFKFKILLIKSVIGHWNSGIFRSWIFILLTKVARSKN